MRLNIFSAKNTVGKFICGLLYCIIYEFIYWNFTYATFKYMGVEHIIFSTDTYILFLIIGAVPICFYKGLVSIASMFSLMVYIFAYIPIMESIFSTESIEIEMRCTYGISLFLLMCMCFLSDKKKLAIHFFKFTKYKFSVHSIFYLSIFFILILFVLNINQLRFVNIITERELMYELREDLSENMFPGSGYIIFWLANAFLPLLLIYFLRESKWIQYSIVITSYLVIFMLTMQKATFLMPFILTIAYKIMAKYHNKMTYYAHSYLILFLIILSAFLYNEQSHNELIFNIAAVFFYRIMCVSGHLFSMYVHFFEDNPYTYYSHINIINNIFHHYPYSDVLGRVVANGAMNANATFLITDGIASCGIIGLWIIGFIFICVKSFFNSILLKYNKVASIVIFLPGVLSFLNVSLFTSLITGGLIILYFLFRNSNLPALYNN